ncbi:MAG: hypothetical protein MAG453_01826 [Calditrichaeota bacterium]|nr:hypothetical protein [Calditrichota bacterium]
MMTEPACARRTPFICPIIVVVLLHALAVPALGERGHWQQRVDYEIDVTLIDSLRAIEGDARIVYANNSPDTLAAIWFRLPPAALRGGSVVDTTRMRGRHRRWSRLDEEEWADLVVGDVVSASRAVRFVQDHSAGRLEIDPPLLPGDSVRVTIPFRTTFPTGRAGFRIACQRGQYKGAYWYPMICPYTPEYGWTVNRYFGTGEAYGEFGDFTLRCTVPYRFIVASTGELVNEHELLPPERLAGLAAGNPDPIPVPDGARGDSLVTWVFRAENVPDVAFAMDPNFLIDRRDYGDFEAWAYVRRGQTDDWSDAAEVCGWTIQQLEEIYGDYPWPRVQASYSWSGMEYPMLTMASWTSPLFRYFIMHEVIHNYTPMILHSNSVDEQWIDEGFTTFIEHELSARWYGTRRDRERTYTRGLFSRTFMERDDVVRGRRPYLEAVLAGEDLPMVRPGDVADDYPLLRVSSYYKTPVLLNSVRYTVGERKFWRGFRVIYDRHALTHVGHEDIISSFEAAAGRSLKETFEQFLYGSGDIDYRLSGYRSEQVGDSVRIGFDVTRAGGIRLPLRLGVVTASGDTLRGEVPYLDTDAPLPEYARWGTWDQQHMPGDRYRVRVDLPAGATPEAVIFDPDGLLVDRNPLDNRLPGPVVERAFDPGLWPVIPPPVDRYRLLYGPSLGYDAGGGALLGVRLRGSYMEREAIWLTDVFSPTREFDRYAPQFRVGLSHPLTRSFGPVHALAYLGRMHGDTWFEAGFRRSWRAWGTWYSRMTVAVKAGTWARDEQAQSALIRPLAVRDSGASPYLHGSLDAKGTLGRAPWTQELRWSVGVGADGFSALSWAATATTRLPWGFSLRSEARLVALDGDPPARFSPTLASGAPYELLGEPLAGGWRRANGLQLAWPYVETPAALASTAGLVGTERFAAVRFSQTRALPKWLRSPGFKPLARFLDTIRYGFFEAGTVFRDQPSSKLNQISYGGEVGVELSVKDLYGLTFAARVAPLYTVQAGESGDFSGRPYDWNASDWLDHTALVLRLDVDRWFH